MDKKELIDHSKRLAIRSFQIWIRHLVIISIPLIGLAIKISLGSGDEETSIFSFSIFHGQGVSEAWHQQDMSTGSLVILYLSFLFMYVVLSISTLITLPVIAWFSLKADRRITLNRFFKNLYFWAFICALIGALFSAPHFYFLFF